MCIYLQMSISAHSLFVFFEQMNYIVRVANFKDVFLMLDVLMTLSKWNWCDLKEFWPISINQRPKFGQKAPVCNNQQSAAIHPQSMHSCLLIPCFRLSFSQMSLCAVACFSVMVGVDQRQSVSPWFLELVWYGRLMKLLAGMVHKRLKTNIPGLGNSAEIGYNWFEIFA